MKTEVFKVETRVETAVLVHAAALKLSTRLQAFEHEWRELGANLSAVVRMQVRALDKSYLLGFGLLDGGWCLFVSDTHDSTARRIRLHDTPIAVQLAALRLLPALQAGLDTELTAAFDAITADRDLLADA